MFPALGETRFSASSNGGNSSSSSSFHYNSFPLASVTGHRSLSEEEQHLYNHHIIENFVESVREMNDVVLIPSKLKDLDGQPAAPAAPASANKNLALSDDLYSYYQMINIVKNDLFEPHNDESKKSLLFSMPKRKISRREQKTNGHNRNMSSSNLAALLGNTYQNGNTPSTNGRSSPDSVQTNGETSPGPDGAPTTTSSQKTSVPALLPLTSDQLIGQNSKQLTVQFIHHLHSLYTILDHFTNAADFITERYQTEVEAAF